MDIRDYAINNLFNYEKVDILSVGYLKQYLEENSYPLQDKDLVIIIPDRNEDPSALNNTVYRLALSNFFARILQQVNKDRFRIKKIIVSDQSDTKNAEENTSSLYTAKDALMSTLESNIKHDILGSDVPEIHYLGFDEDMSRIIYDYLGDYLRMSRKEKGKPVLGKGVNMVVSSLASSEPADTEDRGTVLLFFDAENEQVSYRDPFLLGSPLIYRNSPVLFTKAAFKRYHMEEGKRKKGGRVNASLGVPLINLFIYKGLMPIGKPIIYPFSGEIGIDRDLFWSIRIPKGYGIETATLLQLLGKGKNTLPEESFVQVDLGINMDQPLAEGSPQKDIFMSIKKMSEDVLSSAITVMGNEIKETWKSPEEFMKEFEEFQKHSIDRWIKSHDNKLITGGIGHEKLQGCVYDVVEEYIKRLYDGDIIRRISQWVRDMIHPSDDDIILPVNRIRDDLGDRFDELRERLADKKIRIYPE